MLFKETNLGRLILENIPMEKSADKKVKLDLSEAVRIADGLAKVASYDYNEKVYRSVQEMLKMASDCIVNLKSAYEEVIEKKAQLEKAAEVRSVMDDMIMHGFVEEGEAQEKIAQLMTKSNEQLEIVKEAIKLAGCGKSDNMFFEDPAQISKTASFKKGMFDSIIS